MANRSRIAMMAGQIGRKLQQQFPYLFRASHLAELFAKHRNVWKLPKSLTLHGFIDGLVKENVLIEIQLDFGMEWFSFYVLPEATVYHIGSYGVPRSYLCHQSALELLGLTSHKSKEVYINQEQSAAPAKSKKVALTQKGIDNAFGHERKKSNSRARFDPYELVLLKGQSTSMLGVIELGAAKKVRVKVTDVERTLIDCVVRAAYVGGASSVLHAFYLAKKKNLIDVAILRDYFDRMNFIYPYHQSIGFYLQKAGNYSIDEIDYFYGDSRQYDFYLEYGMEEKEYDPHWRIYYPTPLLHKGSAD